MKAFCLGFLLIGLAYCNGADTNTIPFLVVGEHTYTNAQIIRVNPLYVTLDSDSGFDWAYLSNMPAFFKEKYGYTPEKAAKFIPDQKEAARVQLAKQRAAQLLAQQRAAQLAQQKQAEEQARKRAQWPTLAQAAQNPHDMMYEEAARADVERRRMRVREGKEKRVEAFAEQTKLNTEFANAARRRAMVRENLDEAIEWYSKAAEQGDETAKENLAKATAGQNRLAQWKAQDTLDKIKRAQQAQADTLQQMKREQQDQADTLLREQQTQADTLRKMKQDQEKMQSDHDLELIQNSFKQKP
jgi:hypothetical protein